MLLRTASKDISCIKHYANSPVKWLTLLHMLYILGISVYILFIKNLNHYSIQTPRFSNVCRDYYVSHVKRLFKK